VPVDYTPFNIQYPDWAFRDYIQPGISYSANEPQGYTVNSDSYEPYVYNPQQIQSYMSTVPLVYDPFDPLPSFSNSINSAPPKPAGYQPLTIGDLQAISKIINNK